MSKLLFAITFFCATDCLSSSIIENFFDAHSAEYEELVEKVAYQGPEWIDRKQTFLPQPLTTVLELGCADGLIGRKILRHRPDCLLTGADLSAHMLATCAQKGGYQELIQADMNKTLPQEIAQKKYDLILIMGCLEYVADYDTLFKSVHALLQPNGRFFLTLQADDERSNHANSFAFHVCTEQQARELLEQTGFTIIDWEFSPAGYVDIASKQNVPYYFIIAEKI